MDICIWSKFRQDCFVLDISSTGCRLIAVTAVSCAWTNPLSCLYCFSSSRWLAPSRWSQLTARAVEVVVLFFFFFLDVAFVTTFVTLILYSPCWKDHQNWAALVVFWVLLPNEILVYWFPHQASRLFRSIIFRKSQDGWDKIHQLNHHNNSLKLVLA